MLGRAADRLRAKSRNVSASDVLQNWRGDGAVARRCLIVAIVRIVPVTVVPGELAGHVREQEREQDDADRREQERAGH